MNAEVWFSYLGPIVIVAIGLFGYVVHGVWHRREMRKLGIHD